MLKLRYAEREYMKNLLKMVVCLLSLAAASSFAQPLKIGFINAFQIEAESEPTRLAIEQIKKDVGNKLQGYIIDLRNNPGGLLDQAVSVSDAFLEKGEIVSTRGRRTDDATRYKMFAPAVDPIGKVIIIMLTWSTNRPRKIKSAIMPMMPGSN